MASDNNAWIETFTGKRLHLLDPCTEEIDILDIAHGLSNLCRFTGQVKEFYSVAEHSFYVSWQVPDEDALTALLHDASEAYISDLSRPLKHFTPLGPIYLEIEGRIEKLIAEKFGLTYPFPESVRKADIMMLWTEKDQLMTANASPEWSGTIGEVGTQERAKICVVGWDPEYAEKIFLDRYYTLAGIPNPRIAQIKTPAPSEEKTGVVLPTDEIL